MQRPQAEVVVGRRHGQPPPADDLPEHELREKRDELAQWYEEMKDGSADAWDEISTGVGNAWNSLSEAWATLRKKIADYGLERGSGAR